MVLLDLGAFSAQASAASGEIREHQGLERICARGGKAGPGQGKAQRFHCRGRAGGLRAAIHTIFYVPP